MRRRKRLSRSRRPLAVTLAVTLAVNLATALAATLALHGGCSAHDGRYRTSPSPTSHSSLRLLAKAGCAARSGRRSRTGENGTWVGSSFEGSRLISSPRIASERQRHRKWRDRIFWPS